MRRVIIGYASSGDDRPVGRNTNCAPWDFGERANSGAPTGYQTSSEYPTSGRSADYGQHSQSEPPLNLPPLLAIGVEVDKGLG